MDTTEVLDASLVGTGLRKPRVTVKVIAREAGVSIAAVSRSTSNDPTITDDTRQRVLQEAAEMRNSSDLFACGLVKKRSEIVAVVANNIAFCRAPDGALSRPAGWR